MRRREGRSIRARSDEALMMRVKTHGDERAFAALVRRWERPIQRLGARMTGDAQRGEEIAQEAFARLFTARATYEVRASFGTFLWRIALNLCLDDRRQKARHPERPLDEDGTISTGCQTAAAPDLLPDRALVAQETASIVRGAVLDLPEPYRVVVVLRHYEGLKFREIADVLSIPEGTVKSRMAEALARLSRRLGPLLADEEISANRTGGRRT